MSGGQVGGSVASDLGVTHRILLGIGSVLVVVVGIGSILGITVLTRVRSDWPTIYPYTVFGLIALIVAMVLFDRGGRGGRIIGRLLASIPVLFGIVVDPLVGMGVIPSPDPAGDAVSVATVVPSLAVVATGLAVLMLGWPRDRWPRIRFGLGTSAAAIALLGLLSYVYNSASIFHNLGLTGTSLPTTIIGLVVIGAAMTARPDRPPLDRLDANYDASTLRLLVPWMIVIPFAPAVVTALLGRLDRDPASVNALAQAVTVVIMLAILVIAGAGSSRARRAATREREQLWAAFESSPAATAMMETDGTIRTCNDAWGRLVGTDTASLAGTSVLDAAASAFRGALADALSEVAAGTDSVRMDIQLRRTTGERVWVDAALAPIREGDARVDAVIVQATDLTDRKHLERVLADQASRDPLTGLLNREGLSRELANRGLQESRDGHVNVVVYADVDHLKEVNDTIGHSAGDDLLREVARRLTAALREDDVIARVGGDEFVVVTATRAIGPDPTAVIVSRLRDELAGPVAVGREIVTMSVSLGAAVVTGDVAGAIASADRAMYSERRRRRQSERG